MSGYTNSVSNVSFAGAPDYTALMQACGYNNPPVTQTTDVKRSSGLLDTAKAGLFGFGAVAGATYFGDFKGLTPVDANGMLFEEGLHVLEDKALIQKGLDAASFDMQRKVLGKKGITIANAEELSAVAEYAKTGKIAESQVGLLSFLDSRVVGKTTEIKEKLNELIHATGEKQLENINKYLTENGFKTVSKVDDVNTLLSSLSKPENVDIIKAQVRKGITSDISSAAKAGKAKAGWLAETRSLEGAGQYLQKLKDKKAFFESLTDSKESKDALIKLFKERGSKATEEQLAKAAEKTIQIRQNIISRLTEKISNQQEVVTKLQEPLKAKFASFFDKARGALKEGAPKELAGFFKKFKWNKAAKYGIIAAAIFVAGKLLLDNNKA